MNNIHINKVDLQKFLEENKVKHLKEYNEAMRNYRIGMVQVLEQYEKDSIAFTAEITAALKDTQNGGDMQATFHLDNRKRFSELDRPVSHENDYVLAIEMLALDPRDVVPITQQEYRNYVKDEWAWTSAFQLQLNGNVGIGAAAPAQIMDSITSYGINRQ